MKKIYLSITPSLVLITVILLSCNSDKKIVDKLYKQRVYLLKEFKDKSVISRSEIFYQLSYYKGQSANTFYFEKKDNVLVFTNDTIQYPIHEIVAFVSVNIADSLNYRKALSSELSRLLKVMDNFNISHVSAEERYAGIDMKLYFGDYKALLYVSNVAGIKNERWKNYVSSGKKLDDNWYYVKEEFEK
jgi:response regulator RpfG family c-di-GMP phosphodiesterase